MKQAHRRRVFQSKAVFCVLLTLNLQFCISGCGVDPAPLLAGVIRIELTPDHPLASALRGSAFEDAEALEIEPASGTFRLIFADESRELSGSFSRGVGLPAVTKLHAAKGGLSATIHLDRAKHVTRITTSEGAEWVRPAARLPEPAVGADLNAHSFLAANGELLRLAREMDRETAPTSTGTTAVGGGTSTGGAAGAAPATPAQPGKSGQSAFAPAFVALGVLLAVFGFAVAFEIALFIIFAIIVVMILTLQPSAGWGMMGANAQRTWSSQFSGPATPTLDWTFKTDGTFTGGFAIGPDGTLYVSQTHDTPAEDAGGRLLALNPADASERWVFSQEGWGFGTVSLGPDGSIYVPASSYEADSANSRLFAITPEGEHKWSVALEGNAVMVSDVAVGPDGTLYISATISDGESASSKLYAFAPDGNEMWTFDHEGYGGAATVGKDGVVYTFVRVQASSESTPSKSTLFALAPDGTEKWSYDIEGASSVSLAGAGLAAIGPDGTIFVPAAFGDMWGPSTDRQVKLFALNPDGTEKWIWVSSAFSVVPLVAIGPDGTLYLLLGTTVEGPSTTTTETKLFAISPDGTDEWNFGLGSSSAFLMAIGGDGMIYVPRSAWVSDDPSDPSASGTYERNLHAITPDGQQLWVFPDLQGGTSSSSGGAVSQAQFVVVGSNRLYVIETGGTDSGAEMVIDAVGQASE
jgi:outer membrane protein assembly factor BamB